MGTAAELPVDDDGFYCTGDVGRFVNGHLQLLGRVTNTCKLSNGLFVTAEFLESIYSCVKEVNQVFVFVEPSCACVSAVVVPHEWCLLNEEQMLEKFLHMAKKCKL